MNKMTARGWLAAVMICLLCAHTVWREAYPSHALPGGESENLARLRSWVRSSTDLASQRLRALDRDRVTTGSALAALQEDLGAALREQQQTVAAERTARDQRIESLRVELAGLGQGVQAFRDSLGFWLAAETESFQREQQLVRTHAQQNAAGLQALQTAIAELRDAVQAQDPAAITARLDALAANIGAQEAGLGAEGQRQLAELREAAALRVARLEAIAAQLDALEQAWASELRGQLERLEPGFQHTLGDLAPGVYRLLVRADGHERVLGTAFAVRADGVLATAGTVALAALRARFLEPDCVLEVEACTGGPRLQVLRQSIVEDMRAGDATHDAALLKVDCRGRSLPILALGDARPGLASPIGILFPQPGELGFARGYAAESGGGSLRFKAELPLDIAGAPIVSPEGHVVAVHSGVDAEGLLASAAWSAAWTALLRDF